jgi:hypothetical protein
VHFAEHRCPVSLAYVAPRAYLDPLVDTLQFGTPEAQCAACDTLIALIQYGKHYTYMLYVSIYVSISVNRYVSTICVILRSMLTVALLQGVLHMFTRTAAHTQCTMHAMRCEHKRCGCVAASVCTAALITLYVVWRAATYFVLDSMSVCLLTFTS